MPKSTYGDHVPKQARKLCLLGATDAELADFFEVHRDTISEWKNVHPEFAEAVRAGKMQADAEVAHSLYRLARGYKHQAVKIFADAKTGDIVQVPFVQRYPPNATAGIFWLKNRQRAKWRDKPEDDGGGGSKPILVNNSPDAPGVAEDDVKPGTMSLFEKGE